MCVDEALIRQGGAQLRAQPAHVDVERAIAVARLAPPNREVELVAAHDPFRARCQCDQQLQLAHGEVERPSVDDCGVLVGADLETPGLESPKSLVHGSNSAPGTGPSGYA